MKIIISTLSGQKIGILSNFVSLRTKKVLSGRGNASFTIHTSDPSLSDAMLHPWLDVKYIVKQGNVMYTLRQGVIKNIAPDKKNKTLTFSCIDYIGLLAERRFLRTNKRYDGELDKVIDQVFGYFNNIGALPITLGKNDCKELVSDKLFEAGASFTHIIDTLVKSVNNGNSGSGSNASCEYRCIGTTFDVAKQTGKVLEGVYVHTYKDTQRSNVVDWGWSIKGEDTYNARISKSNNGNGINGTSIAINDQHTDVLLERFSYDPSGHDSYIENETRFHPWAVIDGKKEEWWKVKVGDRKKVSLHGEKDFEQFTFLGIIESIDVGLSNGFFSVVINLAKKTGEYKNNSTIRRTLGKISKKIEVLETTI